MTEVSAEDVLSIDLDHLTVAEIEEVEELADMSIEDLGKPGKRGKMLRALAFVIRKRTQPEFTWEEAGNLRVSFAEEPVPPTDAVG